MYLCTNNTKRKRGAIVRRVLESEVQLLFSPLRSPPNPPPLSPLFSCFASLGRRGKKEKKRKETELFFYLTARPGKTRNK